MVTSTLTKWGNSQGVIIPKSVCEDLGVSVGDSVVFDTKRPGVLEVRPLERRRTIPRTSIDELFADWDGTYEPPSDWPTVGNEIDWGEPVGAEIW